MCGDLTSAFDFSRPEDRRTALPDTSDAAARVADALRLPKPVPPNPGRLPVQESGTRRSRSLLYAAVIEEAVDGDLLRLRFGNAGKAALVYQVHDLGDLDALPRHYTIEPGKALSGAWQLREGSYRLQVRGPNRWFRELRGRVEDSLSVRCRAADSGGFEVELVNRGGEAIELRYRDLLGGTAETRRIIPSGSMIWTVPIGANAGWYDVELEATGSSFFRRLSGRVETGRDSISWPGGGSN